MIHRRVTERQNRNKKRKKKLGDKPDGEIGWIKDNIKISVLSFDPVYRLISLSYFLAPTSVTPW